MNAGWHAVTIGCAVLALACDSRTRRATMPQPSSATNVRQPTPPPSPLPGAGPIHIALGETKGFFEGHGLEYEFISPARGTFIARLDWLLLDSFLTLRIQGNDFGLSYPPIVWPMAVEPGQKITILIGGGGTDEEYDEHFTLTLTLE
jgi:hypothetical protein